MILLVPEFRVKGNTGSCGPALDVLLITLPAPTSWIGPLFALTQWEVLTHVRGRLWQWWAVSSSHRNLAVLFLTVSNYFRLFFRLLIYFTSHTLMTTKSYRFCICRGFSPSSPALFLPPWFGWILSLTQNSVEASYLVFFSFTPLSEQVSLNRNLILKLCCSELFLCVPLDFKDRGTPMCWGHLFSLSILHFLLLITPTLTAF